METAATAARNREELLADFVEFRRSGVEMGRDGSGARTYLLHSDHDPVLARKLARTLARNGIRVSRAEEPVRAGDRTLPAGETWVVPMDQPAHRLARNLLDDHTPMPAGFLEEQRERRAQRLPDQIYDVTAWSLPLLWDVEAISLDREVGAEATPLEAGEGEITGAPRGEGAGADVPEARVGYLIPWSSAGAVAAADLLSDGVFVRTAGAEFTLDGRTFGVGTLVLRNDDNGPELRDRVRAAASRSGAEVVPVDESFVDQGMSLGSGQIRSLPEAPSVALVWDEPTRAYSAGWARYTLEQRYGVPATAIRGAELPDVVLGQYDVIVLPSGYYTGTWSEGFVEDLRSWMRNGGTLVTLAEASRWASRVGLLETTTELRGGAPEFGEGGGASGEAGGGGASAPDQPIDYLEAITPDEERPESVPGAILNVVLDREHWLAAGTDGRIGSLVESDRIFTPITLDRGRNVGRYEEVDDLVAGGIVWEDVRPQLANKAWLVHQPEGRGDLVAFAEDPNYRAYAEASGLTFVNAVLLGAAR